MNRAYLQVWCLSERGRDVLPDGGSLHIDVLQRDAYIKDIYSKRRSEVPNEYEYPVGMAFEVFLDDSLNDELVEKGSIRLGEASLRNLFGMDEIMVK